MNSTGIQTIASPLSTGGAGTFFEQNVGAFFLSLLAVRGIPPILKDCLLDEVHFQANHLGWNTDDLLLVASNSQGDKKQLAAQVKRQFVVSAQDDASKKAFADFWNDFRHNKKFNLKNDKLTLIVLKGTNTLLQTFNSLLDNARASTSGTDFRQRLENGILSAPAKKNAESIRKIIQTTEGTPPSDDDMRDFLACIHVISLDLNTETGLAESLIKSLLSSCTSETDSRSAANKTWSELLQLTASESGGMPAAASYTYDNLPESIRARHNQGIDTGPFQTLQEHCQVTVNSIHCTIAGQIRIERVDLFSELLCAQNENQVVIISSPAGFGKSALAKELYLYLERDVYCLMFRAEEFATTHIDTTMSTCSAGLTAQRLFEILSGQGQVTIFIESIERLLEATVREGFSDLLGKIKEYPNLQLIITCRDYSLNTIQASFLEQKGLIHHILAVPLLTDGHLDQVALENTNISNALKNRRLRELLRIPYMLNKAAAMDWSDTPDTLNVDETVFRKKCWSEVICEDAKTKNGINRRREKTFLEISVRRAKALAPYVRCNDLDAEALQALVHDDLVTLTQETSSLAAPSHDVLEDWAIIQWMENEFLSERQSAVHLANTILGLPALRRGYRKWLSEQLIWDSDNTDQYIVNALSNESLPPYFRDDTIVCMLLSEAVTDFLSRQTVTLLHDNTDKLIRVIHLLRVACKSVPNWLNSNAHVPSVLLQPEGKAWAAVISLVKNSIVDLLPSNTALILGLIEDWSGSVTWETPEPIGFQDTGEIAFCLLQYLDGYRQEEPLSRALKVIAKIPRAQPKSFFDLMARACKMDRKDTIASKFAGIILPGMDSNFCSQYYPDAIIDLIKSAYFLIDEDIQNARFSHQYSSHNDDDEKFGLRRYVANKDFFPSSAIRGPFRNLLRYHPNKGVNLIVELLNHACTWYGEQKWPYNRYEKQKQITIKIPDDNEVVQWAGSSLWGFYRGIGNGPYLIETALMALEDWLLAICKMDDVDVEFWLLLLIKQSNNIAITAVVASICNAYPDKAGKVAIAILSSKYLIEMDRSRMGIEHFEGVFPDYNVENKIYSVERRSSNKLTHRSYDLEALAVKLQCGIQQKYIWQLIDKYREDLPELSEQSEADKIWRLALHRMDTRGYQPMEPVNESMENDDSADNNGDNKRVYFGLGKLESDVQEIVDNHEPFRIQQEEAAKLFNWGYRAWDFRNSDEIDTSNWQDLLSAAKEANDSPPDYLEGGPGFIAGVCVRDYWASMGDEDRKWCVAKLITELMQDCDSTDHSVQIAQGSMKPDRAAAFILPKIMVIASSDLTPTNINEVIAVALTHASTDVRAHAAAGIGHYLYGKDPEFILKCIGSLAMQARLQKDIYDAQSTKPYLGHSESEKLYADVSLSVRDALINNSINIDTEIDQIDLTSWPGQKASRLILLLYSYIPELPQSIDFYKKIAGHLVSEWHIKATSHDHNQNYEFEHSCIGFIAGLVLKIKEEVALDICAPIIEAITEHPKNVAEFVHSLIVAETNQKKESTFWMLWQQFADQLIKAPWIDSLDTKRHNGQELVTRIFFGISWNENIRHWSRLEGNSYRVDELIKQLSGSTHALQSYCRFLYDIGDQSLPLGYTIVANHLSSGTKLDNNSIFYLETLLSRQVYGNPLMLKSDQNVQQAVIHILDHLVEQGSSSAYRMRDDFVTPLAVNDN